MVPSAHVTLMTLQPNLSRTQGSGVWDQQHHAPASSRGPSEHSPAHGGGALLSDQICKGTALREGSDPLTRSQHPYLRLYQYLQQQPSPPSHHGASAEALQNSALSSPSTSLKHFCPAPPPALSCRGPAPSPAIPSSNREKPLPSPNPASLSPLAPPSPPRRVITDVSVSGREAGLEPSQRQTSSRNKRGDTPTRGHAPPPPSPSQQRPLHRAAAPPPPSVPVQSSVRTRCREAPPPPPQSPYRTHCSPSHSDPLTRGKPPAPPIRTPPPPPPSPPPFCNGHASSSAVCPFVDDFESRYSFHPLADFPPPDEFKHFTKIYPSNINRVTRGAPPLPPVGR